MKAFKAFNDFQTTKSTTNNNDAGFAQVCDTRARGN
jgi:hypothetical protein